MLVFLYGPPVVQAAAVLHWPLLLATSLLTCLLMCLVNDLSVVLKIAERACHGLLGFPFCVVFLGKLVMHFQP